MRTHLYTDKQRMLLVDDAYLSGQIPELTEALQSQQTMFRVAVLCLRVLVAAYPDTVHGLSKFLPSLYAACLRERFLQQDKMQELWSVRQCTGTCRYTFAAGCATCMCPQAYRCTHQCRRWSGPPSSLSTLTCAQYQRMFRSLKGRFW